jgi:integrase
VTWKEALTAFLAEAERRLKTRTFQSYRYVFNRHFRFGELKLSELMQREIQRRIDRLSPTPTEQHHAFVVLRTFLRWAHRKHYLETNPMERMASSYRYRPRTRVLSDDELEKVWEAAGDDDFGTIVKALILTGQRVGEITNLSPDMIGEDTITLPKWLTKNGREHTFPVGPLAKDHILRLPLRKVGSLSTASFENYQRHKARLDKASDVSGWTLHDLRRTFASGLAANGVALPVTEKLLNHVSGSFSGIVGVYQTYDYAKEKRAAMKLWEAHVSELIAPASPGAACAA